MAISRFENEKFEHWDQLIRRGRGLEVRQEILKLDLSKLQRKEKVHVAVFFRRVGLVRQSVNLLRPLIRPSKGTTQTPLPSEVAEYASSLIREGVANEGIELLKNLKHELYPDSLLYLTFGYFARWDYKTTIPILKTFLNLNKDPYQKVVGQVNLAAAQIFVEDYADAEETLKEVSEESEKSGYKLLYGYSLELLGQLHLSKRNFTLAKAYFRHANLMTGNSGTNETFLVRKWQTLLELIKVGEMKNSANHISGAIEKLNLIRTEARKLQDWETLRICDYHQALATKDQNLAIRVYFGTPHYSFRLKLQDSAKDFLTIPQFYEHSFFKETSSRTPRILDMSSGRELDSTIHLKSGKTLHRLLRIITSDFYRPLRSTEIFSLLFRGEYFDPAISINRVHQAIMRLREWLDENEVPLEIAEQGAAYEVTGHAPYLLRRVISHNMTLQKDRYYELFRAQFRQKTFALNEICAWLEIPSRTASRIIKEAEKEGWIHRQGAGPSTRYTISE